MTRIEHGISNLALVLSLVGYGYKNSSKILIPSHNTTGNSDSTRLAINNTQIVIQPSIIDAQFRPDNLYVTIQYTKTTL